ncbi:hypothetical protein [Lacrimispora sp. JR3]|uniref:hypothetical protein n=1 Tax=Lacrimispora sinapis TaxID=3111456 RepID=UPI0037478D41
MAKKLNIRYLNPDPGEINKVSEQIMVSYTSAYRGLMDHEYLSSLVGNHWVSILQERVRLGDICLVAEIDGKIIGSAVFSVVNHLKKLMQNGTLFICCRNIQERVLDIYFIKRLNKI